MLNTYFKKNTEIYPLVSFRIFFGLLMFVSIVRFAWNGWIDTLYIQPNFFFSYYGFDWIKPLGNYTYILFIISAISSLFIALGYKYRISIIVFFLSFTYIELMDKTTYLNHYYFISLVSFLLIFLPANANFSIDSYADRKLIKQRVPSWTIDSIKLMLGIVYFYAGLAKINSDWLLRAEPLKTWLSVQSDLPIVGSLMKESWFHYLMSWSGCLYDLLIPFLLLNKRTRIFAFVLVVIFHVFTRILFPIGMFPYIMIFATLVFFSSDFHEKLLRFIASKLNIDFSIFTNAKTYSYSSNWNKLLINSLVLFFIFQILFPFRYVFYKDELFWNEEGYRFSWRVMLMEKSGYTTFKVVDNKTQKVYSINNCAYLTPFQEKEMSTQPDFILEYAHFLGEQYKKKGIFDVSVYAESYVSLNGRQPQQFIDSNVDLLKEYDSFKQKKWILPLKDTIYGL
ncbi:MAG: HTTM domain-containing protein [Flavobacteriales bacterium]|nr:HTTM domain-containing protein [Flavobacteriales bacterium]